MADHDFNHAVLSAVSHRPWPVPSAPWVMTQTWHDLLFAHWPVAAADLRRRVPSAFEIDEFDGRAWIGVVPFRMTNAAPRGVPSLPRISEFSELNVRTYVRAGGRPGVFFFSLDADSLLAVRAARMLLNLPYYTAAMRVAGHAEWIGYDSRRRDAAAPGARLSVAYRPSGAPWAAAVGSLEYFLAERYCLYNLSRRGTPYRLDIHHPPWMLQPADAEFRCNTMADAAGLSLADTQPLLHFSRRQDMVAWAPSRLDR